MKYAIIILTLIASLAYINVTQEEWDNILASQIVENPAHKYQAPITITSKRSLETENTITNASVISFSDQTNSTLTSQAYEHVLTKPKRFSTNYILYPYNFTFTSTQGEVTLTDGAIITLPNTTLPDEGTSFKYYKTETDVKFNKAKPLYDINVGIFSLDVKVGSVTMDVFTEASSYCSILSFKYGDCIQSSQFVNATLDVKNAGKTFLVYLAPAELESGILFTNNSEKRFGLIILPDFALTSDAVITNAYANGIESLKKYVNEGGKIITSGKSGYLLEKWGILPADTYNPGKIITSIETNSIATILGCESSSDDFDLRTLCMNLKQSDGIYRSFAITSFQLKNADTFQILMSIDPTDLNIKGKDSASGTYIDLTSDEKQFLPFILHKNVGNGHVYAINGNPASKSTYKQLLYNLMFLGMQKPILFNVELQTTDNLPIPGGEAGIIINSKLKVYNLFEKDVSNVVIYIYLPNNISSTLPYSEGCEVDTTNYPQFDYLKNITSVNTSNLIVCTKPTLLAFEKLDIEIQLEIMDQSATQMLYDIMMLYPILEYTEDSDKVIMDYGGVLTTAALAALLRTTLNPDPVGFFPLFGRGQYVDNVLNVENKEGTEAFDTDYIAVVPLISPIVDSNDQSMIIQSIEFLNEYYQTYGYVFPFEELDDYDMLDVKYLNGKGVVLVAEWDGPVKAGKEFRNTTTHPEFPDLENVADSPLDIVNLGMTVTITNVNYAIKQIYFRNADLFFEHASARQLVYVDETTVNGANSLYHGVFPDGVKNPNVAENVAKITYLWCRQDIYFYDVQLYPRPQNISVDDVFTVDKVPRQSPLVTEQFGKGTLLRYVNGYFNSSLEGGLKKNQFNNALLMYASKNPINMTGNYGINETTNGTVKLIHYLVPTKERVKHATDVMGFTATSEDEGFLAEYPDVKFINAHTTYVMIPGEESRQGGMIHIQFNDPIIEDSLTFSADQVAFYQIEYDIPNKVVTAFYKRGLFSNEAYGKPSNISICMENIASPGDVIATITLYEMKFDLSSKETKFEKFFLRQTYVDQTLYRQHFFSLPALELHVKLPRVNGSTVMPYELLDPYTRFGIYYQELLLHSTVWVLVESHHQTDPGINTISSAYSMVSNIGISSIPFIEYLTVGAGQLIPFVAGTSRVEWTDIWGRRWVQAQRSVFADVVPLPGPTLNFMMSTTFELTKANTTERVLMWNTEEDIDIKVQIKLYNNYPKYFDETYCKDNEIPYMETGRGRAKGLVYAPPDYPNGTYDFQISANQYPTDDYHINFANRAVYGMCFDEPGTKLEGNDLTQDQINTISTAHLCAETLNETMIKQCIIERLAEHLPTLHRFDSTWKNLTKWIFSPDVEDYYPENYISQDMFDLSHQYYDDTPFTKSFPYHMDNLLPQIDTKINKPHNVIAQPIYKGLGYKITYDRNMTLAKYPGHKGWWSDNLQNKDKTLLAAQSKSNEVSVDKETLLPADKWINDKDLKNPLTNATTSAFKNIYVCLYNQHRVKMNVTDPVIGHLHNVVQNNIVPIIPDLEKDDPRITDYNCTDVYQYTPDNISMIDNTVYTPTIRDWLYFAANLRGEALETINIPMFLTSYSKLEGMVKIQDGGRFVYWNPCCGPNTFLIVDNPVNLVEAYRTDVQISTEVFPKQTPTFNANIYSLFTIVDPEEEMREWKDLTYDSHYGFGDSTISVFVGGTEGSKAILNTGDSTYIKITLYNNAGYDWHMYYGAIDFESMPEKPTNAMYFQGMINAIQVPTKYNFIIVNIPDYLKDYIELAPSGHNADVAPQFFDFQNINVVTIKDGFKGDYFYKLVLTKELPIEYQGRVHEIGFTLNESYFDHLPGYNDLTVEGYHDYRLLIPCAKIAVPYSDGVYKGKVFYTLGYSYNVSLSLLIPNYFTNMEFRAIKKEEIINFRDASGDMENYDALMQEAWETYPLINTSFNTTTVDSSFVNITTGTLIPKFPIHNDVLPDTASYYILMRAHASQIASGTNIVLSNPIVSSVSFNNKTKFATIPTPNFRIVKSKGAWITAKYNTTVMTLEDDGTYSVNPDQRIFATDTGIIKIHLISSNIGGDTAYNVNFTLLLGEATNIIEDTIKVEHKLITNSSGSYFQMLTKRKLPVGELYAEDVFLTFTPITTRRRNLDVTGSRLFVKSVATSIDLTETYGQSQVTQVIASPSAILYKSGLREFTTLVGEAYGMLVHHNLTIYLSSNTINADPTAQVSYKFSRKLSSYNTTSTTDSALLESYKTWSVIRNLDVSNTAQDAPFPTDFNSSTLNTASMQYKVESYDQTGKFLSTNLWQYDLNITNKSSSKFPWFAILIIVLLGVITLGVILAFVIVNKKKRKNKITSDNVISPDKEKVDPKIESVPSASQSQSMNQTDAPMNVQHEKIVYMPEIKPLTPKNASVPEQVTILSSTLPPIEEAKHVPLEIPTAVINEEAEEEVESAIPLSKYSPIKNDKTDILLAEELQEYFSKNPDISIQMARVKEGVYMYGKTKLGVVVANGKVIIRVGGGYMSLEEFLKTYTPLEMARNTRSNVYKSYEAKLEKIKGMKAVAMTTINP